MHNVAFQNVIKGKARRQTCEFCFFGKHVFQIRSVSYILGHGTPQLLHRKTPVCNRGFIFLTFSTFTFPPFSCFFIRQQAASRGFCCSRCLPRTACLREQRHQWFECQKSGMIVATSKYTKIFSHRGTEFTEKSSLSLLYCLLCVFSVAPCLRVKKVFVQFDDIHK